MLQPRLIVVLASVSMLVAGCGGDDPDRDPPPGGFGPGINGNVNGNVNGSDTSEGDVGDAGETDDMSPSTGPFVPAITGTCPDLLDGTVTFTPASTAPRDVRVHVDPAAVDEAPMLVIYWHSSSGGPGEAVQTLGPDVIDTITSAGGIVAAPSAASEAGADRWYRVSDIDRDDDLILADEIAACAVRDHGIRDTRLHTVGFGVGGIQAALLAEGRSGWVASVATWSGGIPSRGVAEPAGSGVVRAMILHGGGFDVLGRFNFAQASANWWTRLDDAGLSPIICNHMLGHNVALAARSGVFTFLEAHPWDAPFAWPDGLPDSLPPSCEL